MENDLIYQDRVTPTAVTSADVDSLIEGLLNETFGMDTRVIQAAEPSFIDAAKQSLISRLVQNPRYAWPLAGMAGCCLLCVRIMSARKLSHFPF
jgi:hypothetical protein